MLWLKPRKGPFQGRVQVQAIEDESAVVIGTDVPDWTKDPMTGESIRVFAAFRIPDDSRGCRKCNGPIVSQLAIYSVASSSTPANPQCWESVWCDVCGFVHALRDVPPGLMSQYESARS